MNDKNKKPETTVPFFARQASAAIPVRSDLHAGRESRAKYEEDQKLGGG